MSDCSRKGVSVDKYVSDYTIFDLETTSKYSNSTKIIELGALKVRENKVVDSFSTLVNPSCHIPSSATEINNITDDMVINAPMLDDVIDAFMAFVGSDIVVGFNNSTFDNSVLNNKLLALRGSYFSNDYVDVYYAAKRSIRGLINYKLETISKYYNIDTIGEHRALKDCYLTKAVYDKLYEEFGEWAFVGYGSRSNYSGEQKVSPKYTEETLALQEIQEFLAVALSDNEIDIIEFQLLKEWLAKHNHLRNTYPFKEVFEIINDILEDGCVSSDELEQLRNICFDIVDPVKAHACNEDIVSIVGMHVCITGEFDYGSRGKVLQLIENAGGINDKSLKKSTNYLVVGSQGSSAWKAGNYGGKILKAMQFNEKGACIKIIEESVFISAISSITSD